MKQGFAGLGPPIHAGLVELQEGLVGWWRACHLELLPGHLLIFSVNTDSTDLVANVFLDPRTFLQAGVVPGTDGRFVVATATQQFSFRGHTAEDGAQWVDIIVAAAREAEERCGDEEWAFVYLNIYDLLTDWRVSAFNAVVQDVLGKGGIFHAGVEVYGQEYMFGAVEGPDCYDGTLHKSGISTCKPQACGKHTFRQAECLGLTTQTRAQVDATIERMAAQWSADDYRIFSRNCVTFCRDFSQRLGIRCFPDWVDSLARVSGERQILQPPCLEMGKGQIAADQQQQFRCPAGHTCVYQAQSFLASFIEIIVCERCFQDLVREEPHWYCPECDIEICRDCASHALVSSVLWNGRRSE